jgi:histidinol-phosphate phosphatase family protein
MSLPPKIILLIGFQASTKSTAAQEILKNVPNAVIISRDDTKGVIESLLPKVEAALNNNHPVIIDNTNLSRASRKLFIDLANKLKVPIDGHYFQTTIEDCQIRHLRRMYEKWGEIYQTGKGPKDPHCFPPVVFAKAKKDFEPPQKEEGYAHLIAHNVPHPAWDPATYKNKALFLDIDGTLRETEHLPNKYPTHPDEVQLIRPQPQMLAKLKSSQAAGYRLIGVSNQSGISKGTVSQQTVEAIFERTRQLIGLTAEELPIMYCPHPTFPQACFCRKPSSGMAMEAIMKLKLDPTKCIMVGDMKSDEEMAARLQIPFIHTNAFWE